VSLDAGFAASFSPLLGQYFTTTKKAHLSVAQTTT
jgi:hypothetical protein